MAEKWDVVICGSGSAGIAAATWLARYGIRCKVLERRDGPLQMGQADGVQCRTVEIFESFDIADKLLSESYHVLEVVFWTSDENGNIKRSGRTADTQPGLSHQPHVILNQARVNGLLIGKMLEYNNQVIDYGYDVKRVDVDDATSEDPRAYPVTVTAQKDGRDFAYQAKYVLAGDGAHSVVRKAIKSQMIGDSTDAVWGVMDVIPRTNFPDIRKKATVRSKAGYLLNIPREGGTLTRFYIELPPGTKAKEVALENLQQTAQRILDPYRVDFVDTVWWSAFSIGQRSADVFHKNYRVFLAGDACHTHSPKAGQGMNTSLQDGYNIGWKLGMVITGLATPSLLETYVLERQKVANDLIDFDRYFSKLFSSSSTSSEPQSGSGASSQEFQEGFIKAGRYTAGLTAKYERSMITTESDSSEIATGLTVGMRLPSSQVIRFCDSNPLQLARCLTSNGRWRLMVFSGDLTSAEGMARLQKIGDYLNSEQSPMKRFTPADSDLNSLVEPILVAHGDRHGIEQEQIPECFCPAVGKNQIKDLHKVFFDDQAYDLSHGQLYKYLGIDPAVGAVVIVRPDQYISAIMRMEDHEWIGNFFEPFLISRR